MGERLSLVAAAGCGGRQRRQVAVTHVVAGGRWRVAGEAGPAWARRAARSKRQHWAGTASGKWWGARGHGGCGRRRQQWASGWSLVAAGGGGRQRRRVAVTHVAAVAGGGGWRW
ncbi:hypothetical protein [Actinocrispum wychmicini]|uniref:hypothetical protein n=1 Tax=Actinocrispum wychmicini TaxID=1213861 RepID=UPI0010504E08|nr:hypothetical protein [Actinocrispum wychmicini]